MGKIAIIDADLIGRKRHRFPNLCCMKISGYYKACGYQVELKTDYYNLTEYNKVYVAKVFTDTPTPDKFPENVTIGGTGFFLKKQSHCHCILNIICPIIIYTTEFVTSKRIQIIQSAI